MFGAAINVVPFMIQRNVPGIGSFVLEAFLFAIIPALFAAMAYAILGSAMPRAGGSYVYASRALNPYLGFVASFAQWFGLSTAIGVVSYVLITFFRDIASALQWEGTAQFLEMGFIKVGLALGILWIFVYINIIGVRIYEKILVPMMFMMFILGGIVIVAGFFHNQADFAEGLRLKENIAVPDVESEFDFGIFLAASAVLFSSFIGFDSIAQAGGEAKNPGKSIPMAVMLAISVVGGFYFLFTAAVYHTVPWEFIAERAQVMDVTAPGLLTYVLPMGWAIAIICGAAIALINDLPAMLLAVSRLMFAWAGDGIFPKKVEVIHPRYHTPINAILLSGAMASVSILGSHFAGDFFLGIDILVTSMLVNFILMCFSVFFLKRKNPELAGKIVVGKNRSFQIFIAICGGAMLVVFLLIHLVKDLSADVSAWYFHSTPVWLIVMAFASLIYLREVSKLKKSGVDIKSIFNRLPPE